MKVRWLCITIIALSLIPCLTLEENRVNNDDDEDRIEHGQKNNKFSQKDFFLDNDNAHSRKKRLIWVTDDGRLALPPGTSLTISPTIALPLVRHPPEGFYSNLSISFPLTIDFDKLGLTDNQNPLGDLPPIFSRSFARSAGQLLGGYISNYMRYRIKRSIFDGNDLEMKSEHSNFEFKENIEEPPKLPEKFKHIFHGGERVLLYAYVEDFLSTFGVNGRGCLLRTVCEIHSRQIEHLGLFGEITRLFLTASKSPFASHIEDYVKAEMVGKGKAAPGECFPYYKECPKSVFKEAVKNRYRENSIVNDKQSSKNTQSAFSM